MKKRSLIALLCAALLVNTQTVPSFAQESQLTDSVVMLEEQETVEALEVQQEESVVSVEAEQQETMSFLDSGDEEEPVITIEDSVSEFIFQEGAFSVLNESEPLEVVTEASTDFTAMKNYLYQELKKKTAKIDFTSYQYKIADTASATMQEDARNSVKTLVSAVLNEHPDLFHVTGGYSYSYSSNGSAVYLRSITPQYETGEYDQEAFQREVKKALACVSEDMTDREKAIALHDYLALICEYDMESYTSTGANTSLMPPNVFKSYGVLVDRTAVCQGYALAYKYLLEQVGIPAYMVTSDSMCHAWNMIKLDGEYYQVDVTWDDPTWDLLGRVCHGYMFLSDTAITAKKHKGWKVTDGSSVVSYQATSTLYDDAFWMNVSSPMILNGDSYYYTKYQNGKANLIKNPADAINTSEEEILYDQIGKWNAWNEAGTYAASYAGLYQIDDRFFYNTADGIWSINVDGSEAFKEFEITPAQAGGYIYGMYYEDGKFSYVLETDPNIKKKQTRLMADISVISKPTISPQESEIRSDTKITLAKTGEGDIYYTIDGTEPSSTNGTKYTEPFTLSKPATVKAVVCVNDKKGHVASFTYDTVKRVQETGQLNDAITWTLIDDKNHEGGFCLEISGKGDMPSVLAKEGDEGAVKVKDGVFIKVPWKTKLSQITSISVDQQIKKIANYAFAGMTELDQVSLNQGLESIGEGAFFQVPCKQSVSIPDSVKEIGKQAFLSTVELYGGEPVACYRNKEDGAYSITELSGKKGNITWLIDGSTGGNTIVLSGEGVLSAFLDTEASGVSGEVASFVAKHLDKIEHIEIGYGITKIQGNVFQNYSKLSTVWIPSTVTAIEEGVFAEGLKVTVIGFTGSYAETFAKGQTGWKFQAIPTGSTAAGWKYDVETRTLTISKQSAMEGYRNISADESNEWGDIYKEAKTIVIEAGVTEIPIHQFDSFEGVTSINIPNTVTKIGAYAFFQCYSLEEIQIPDSVTYLGMGAFSFSGIQEIKLPASIKTLSYYTYYTNKTIPTTWVVPASIEEMMCTFGANSPEKLIFQGEEIYLGSILKSKSLPTGTPTIYVKKNSKQYVLEGDNFNEYTYQYSVKRTTKRCDLSSVEKIVYDNLTFDANGGKVTQNPAYFYVPEGNGHTYGEIMSQLGVSAFPIPERENYAFLGWYTEKTGGVKVGFLDATTNVKGDVTLYAHWKTNIVEEIPKVPSQTLDELVKAAGVTYAYVNTTRTLKGVVPPTGFQWKDASQELVADSNTPTIMVDAFYQQDGVNYAVKLPVAVSEITDLSFTGADKLLSGDSSEYQLSYNCKGYDCRDKITFSWNQQPANVLSLGELSGGKLQITANTVTKATTVNLRVTLAMDGKTVDVLTAEKNITVASKEYVTNIDHSFIELEGSIGFQAEEDTLKVEAKELTTATNRSIQLTSVAKNNDAAVNTAIKWTSSDTSVVDVKAKDSTGKTAIVTFQKAGKAVLTATAQDKGKYTKEIVVTVSDRKPVLDVKSLTVNAALSEGVEIPIYAQNGFEITDLQVSAAELQVEKRDGVFYLHANVTKAQNITTDLTAVTGDGSTVFEKVKVKVTYSLPKITWKQTSKPNLFYKDATAVYRVSAPAGITKIEQIDTPSEGFVLETPANTDQIQLVAKGLTADNVKTFYKQVKLRCTVNGYQKPVEVTLKIGTENKKPSLKINDATVVKDSSATSTGRTTKTRIIDTKTKGDFDLTKVTINPAKGYESFADFNLSDTNLEIVYAANKSASYKVVLSHPNWIQDIQLSGKVKVVDKYELQLDTAKIILNTNVDAEMDVKSVQVSVKNNQYLEPNALEVKPDARAEGMVKSGALIIDGFKNPMEVKLDPAKGTITPGTYKIAISSEIDGNKTKATTLTIVINQKTPDITLSKKGSINVCNREGTALLYTPKIVNTTAALRSVELSTAAKAYFTAQINDKGIIEVRAKEGASLSTNKTYTCELTMKLQGYEQKITKKVQIKVTNKAPKITANVKKAVFYRTSTSEKTIQLSVADETASIGRIVPVSNKTSKYFIIDTKADAGTITVKLSPEAEKLKKGSYSISCQVYLEGQADNAKPVTVKCSIVVK